MNSFNVYGYLLKSTDIVAMKDITDFKDTDIKQVYRTPDDLKHTTSFSPVSILARFLSWYNVYCHLASRCHSSHVSKNWLKTGSLKRKSGDCKHNFKVTKH